MGVCRWISELIARRVINGLYFLKVGPKLKKSKALCKNDHEMVSNAFSKSIITIIPNSVLFFVISNISSIVLMLSPMYLPFI